LEVNPPPDLQELAQRCGGLGWVPPEAWAEYDYALRMWEAKRRARHTEDF
jgi:hypothetical protein